MDDIDVGKLGIDPALMEQMLEEQITAKRKRRPRRAVRHIGAPQSFVSDVCLLTEGRATLLVALCIYRRTCVCDSQTVTLPSAELAALNIDRRRKREALARLQNVGLIRVRNTAGRTSRITLTW